VSADGNLPGSVEAHVDLRGIGKSFGGTRVLHGIDLTIARGSVHGLVGENGRL